MKYIQEMFIHLRRQEFRLEKVPKIMDLVAPNDYRFWGVKYSQLDQEQPS